MIRFRQLAQAFFLFLFLALLTAAAISGLSISSPDIFLQMDPGLCLITAISAKTVMVSFIPAALVLLSGLIAGRIFCGYICPMGTTLDVTDSFLKPGKKHGQMSVNLRQVKYLLLCFLMGAAVLGVSFIFLASPLSLITRFYGLLVFPVLSFACKALLVFARPLGDMLDLTFLSYFDIRTLRFATQFFILFFFITVFFLVRFSPRFWCRYLCPSGALIALFSKRPLIRRQVSDNCTDCGRCTKRCPMSAIRMDDPLRTAYSECIVCRTCEQICPEHAVSFTFSNHCRSDQWQPFSITRRHILTSGIIGAGSAMMTLTGLASVHGSGAKGQIQPDTPIRPPGSVIESDFLARCTRCGECMTACPTNTLQPIWFESGAAAVFSPVLTPRRGYCDPHCHECARTCPTDAIRQTDPNDRHWAKTGTAHIMRHKCLAWEFDKSCMVCDEVCPYGAVDFTLEPGRAVPVPHVAENRCAGCGYCEHFCPVKNSAAIVVSPMDAVRINTGRFEDDARAKGFNLDLEASEKEKKKMEFYPEVQNGSAPGFDE